jgi:hypothetical protein
LPGLGEYKELNPFVGWWTKAGLNMSLQSQIIERIDKTFFRETIDVEIIPQSSLPLPKLALNIKQTFSFALSVT